ncbi:MAG: carboxypeptidase-like regulatory domain-containing protein [Reichenbachiella sp.]
MILLIILSYSHETFAGKIYGIITDEKNIPLPFATLYVNETTYGTTSNLEGSYGLILEPGRYELVFQYVGYKKKIVTVDLVDQDVALNIQLESEALELKEVVITSDEEDPAYPVIRAAIERRKYHLNEVQAYKCQVYIKGLQSLKSRPDKVFGYNVPVDTGIVYLSESISELSIEKPDKIKETMISSKVSGNISTFSYNQGSQMLFTFYDNLVKVVGLSERSFVSPIAENALFFYDYELKGVFFENDLMINKIKVIPKRKNDPVFEGYIYIIENKWRVHSTDLILTKEHQIEFLNHLVINQVFAPVDNGIWMMISQTFNYELDAFGFKGVGNFTGVHSNYQIEPNYDLVNQNRKLNGQSEIPIQPKLFSSKYFTNEVLDIKEGSNKKSGEYWQTVRPVPLTDVEKADYQKNDSLKSLFNSRAYKDSVDKYVNKISIENILYSGYTKQNSFHEKYYSFDPIIRTVLFNSIEGLTINLKPHYTKYREEVLQYSITPEVRYGFSSNEFYGRLSAAKYFNPKRFTKIYGSAGSFVSQINKNAPVLPFVNTLETLLLRNNLIKLYEKQFLKIGYRNEIKNGFLLESNLEYAHRNQLFNTSDYSFFGTKDFTSNTPDNLEIDDTSFDSYNAFVWYVKLRIEFEKKYISRPDAKIALDSKYPRLEIYYRKGIPVFGSNVDYDHIMGMIAGNYSLGLVGHSAYTVQAGTFLNSSQLNFPDFKHFNTNQSVIGRFGQYRFELLDYYLHSTTSRYYIFHFRHHFNGFIFNKLPLLRKTKVQVVASFSYLNTISTEHYFEYGVGLEHIFKLLRAGFYTSTIGTDHYSTGFRVGIGF